MKNKYVDFISDQHFLECVANLHKAYTKAKNNLTKRNFYSNKVDTIKLTFDSKFNEIDEESLIKGEILRQIDKSINNSIGTFHEQILGGIKGFEVGKLSGFDIKANDDTLFADIKNKHNTMNSSSAEALFQKLARYADTYKKAKCYWVQILAKNSFCNLWHGEINGKEYSHSRVYKISGDQFYALLSGQEDAFFQLYKKLPLAVNDYLKSIENSSAITENSALEEINEEIKKTQRTVLNQITFENYSFYLGFDKL
ncbi:Eco47II family restriction endonuclease [Flavobacterium azooxidireducens]|uniref:Eco47II family restriction endonuclease n=1 Tax=Flavobacterium azooxidireducens TaxID=1871076 RepID=A0ABY4KID2_9FLAO|nr:Eco47II family restriction endonuclease [Flavobacterium azooxidireducens]UPQ80601.1 Eco47II family restriction endonuclease [Flavobacterium azooxidireducens]